MRSSNIVTGILFPILGRLNQYTEYINIFIILHSAKNG